MARSLRVRVIEVIAETADTCSLVLEPAEPDAVPIGYRPGQFLTVHVPTTREEGAARCYSMSSSPLCGEKPKITVKRKPGGYGSNWICDNVAQGSTLEILRPAGTFTTDSLDHDFLFLAAGSGITPVMSILKSALEAGTGAATLVYANRDENSVIFRDELFALSRRHPERLQVIHWLESVQGLPTRSALRALAAPNVARRAFVCGPDPFMDEVVAGLAELGKPRADVRVERFLSLRDDPFAVLTRPRPDPGPGDVAAAAVEVTLDGETRTVPWPRDRRLLDVLLDNGVDAPFSCREGRCSACACRVLDGELAMDHNEVLEQPELDEGYVLACQARPVTDRIRVTYDE